MKVLRLKLYQETACYKKPHALKVSETYPLPPFATVKGMLHALLDANELIPMKLCIQGEYETLVHDYQTHYFFKSNKTEEFPLTVDGLNVVRDLKDITTMPIYRHLLYGVQLCIFVQAEMDVLEKLQLAFFNCDKHLSLGRWEDLLRVDACEIVDVEQTDEVKLKYNAFVPNEFLEDDIASMPYRLNWTYRIIKGVRVWDKIAVGYVEKGISLEAEDEPLYVDDEETPVFFHD